MTESVPFQEEEGRESSLSVAGQEESSPEPNHAGTLQNCETHMSVVYVSQSVVFCNGSSS